jgi:hypothetical protein
MRLWATQPLASKGYRAKEQRHRAHFRRPEITTHRHVISFPERSPFGTKRIMIYGPKSDGTYVAELQLVETPAKASPTCADPKQGLG